MNRIRFCRNCEAYTLNKTCTKCGKETEINAPQKYSKDETVAYYRRKLKKEELDKA
ncbi:MAG: H/ACA RNA-protein complex component Nop10p [Candidatus Parvarchaeum acidophilus ARMAN-5]|jgi:rRNA maturation protein Nop10|uniref:H/ACA RNA-protein complex component Nop10p n=1 Tax=Candidatus Parvarchaeum acidophilus ARMAN-5 TaxID=662762 RepID=D6GWX3_PARA5|nr:MAG: H/ACA RNA-protein complex component Nop10p [Candidatus Parvarchaeum acidophilus ARMAN-5]